MSIVTDYKVGLKTEIVRALAPIFGPQYPDPQLRGKVAVTYEYPRVITKFPAIYINYSEGPIQNVGVGHYEREGDLIEYKHFKFRGDVNFNVLALTAKDRDLVTAGLLNVLAFSDRQPEFAKFHKEIHDSDWIRIQMLKDEIQPAGETTGPVPWDSPDELIYAARYSVALFGEFYSNPATGQVITISEVNAYPYNYLDPAPQGTPDPSPWLPQ